MKMNGPAMQTLGVFFLVFAAYKSAGYYFGWSIYRPGDWIPMVLGGLSGGVGVFLMNRRKVGKPAR